ncbi:hypothetical protein [Arthrobacter sp. UYCo732]|uniref:hypothetical protein n=1 Tax=Arthrobacter sp. UYCo732 TaxID=3156336 RepID=UPI0033910732
MPIRQHPLLRYYAEALDHISLASLAGYNFPPKKELMLAFHAAVAALPPIPTGEDGRHDEIRGALEAVAWGGRPDRGSFRTQARWAAGRLADYTAKLATMGTEIPAQVVPGSVLHYFSDGVGDQERYGLGHRRILEVTDFGITFQVADGVHIGAVGQYTGSGDPEHLAEYLQPAQDCGPDCCQQQ